MKLNLWISSLLLLMVFIATSATIFSSTTMKKPFSFFGEYVKRGSTSPPSTDSAITHPTPPLTKDRHTDTTEIKPHTSPTSHTPTQLTPTHPTAPPIKALVTDTTKVKPSISVLEAFYPEIALNVEEITSSRCVATPQLLEGKDCKHHVSTIIDSAQAYT